MTMWNKCFIRSFAHRLASKVNDEEQERMSIDSFIDVVDLKPENERPDVTTEFAQKCQVRKDSNNNSISSGSEEEDILPETYIQGPKAASKVNGGIKRRISQKLNKDLIKPLIKSCCSDIKQNFKEFLRFDFSHTHIFDQSSNETVLTPDT